MIKISTVLIDSLVVNKWNPNVMSPDNEAKLEESIRRNGFFKPLLVRSIDNRLEIIGGEHRWSAAKRVGYKEVPVINLGEIDDDKAKEYCILDNGRYGSDDSYKLAELLADLGGVDDLAAFMPYSSRELDNIFSSVAIALDDLELPDDVENVSLPAEKPQQTHSIMRFRIAIEDCGFIQEMIEKTMKEQRLNDNDSMTNAGDALVYILNNVKNGKS